MGEAYRSDAEHAALSGTTPGAGLTVPATDTDPWVVARAKFDGRLADAMVPLTALEVYKDTTGDLKFGVRAGQFMDGDTVVNYAGATNQAATNTATNYIYLTAAGTLTVSTTAFPDPRTTPHIPLAEIVCAGGVFSIDDGDITDRRPRSLFQVQGRTRRFCLAAFGTWAVDGDGAETNGGGIIGDVTLTEAAAALCKVYDVGTTTYANLSASGDLTGWAANYQLTADAASEAINDAAYFGGSVPFCEIALDIATGGVYGDDAFTWEYWDGDSWETLTLSYDSTDTTANDGLRSFQQDGAISFVPPSDWASSTIDSQAAYWIRARVSAVQVTTTPKTNNKEHEIVTTADGATAPCACRITGIRAVDAATTLHTATDVKFCLLNFTTGEHSGELTWAQDLRADSWASLTMDCAAGDSLGVLVTQEDGANEALNVLLEITAVMV